MLSSGEHCILYLVKIPIKKVCEETFPYLQETKRPVLVTKKRYFAYYCTELLYIVLNLFQEFV